MKRKEELKQLNKLWKKMKKHIKAFLKTENQEDLHQFRVQVKKIKALLTLYAYKPANKKLLKTFKPVKKIFKKAGDIRNAYINLNLSEKYQLNDKQFNDAQQQNMKFATDDFKRKGSKYLKSIKEAHVVLQNNILHLTDKKIRQFYKEKLLLIDTFFADLTFDEKLHDARKNIKLLVYNQKITVEALQNKVKINFDYLDELQNQIGDWHDHVLTIEVFSGKGKAEDDAVNEIKKSNAELEKSILIQSGDFKEKVSATEENIKA